MSESSKNTDEALPVTPEHALYTCVRTMTYLLDAEAPTTTDWLNLRVARNLALRVLDGEHVTSI